MLGRLRFVQSHESDRDPLLQEAVEAVRQQGVEPVWVREVGKEGERGCIYVVEDFDTLQYKAVAGRSRVVGPPAVVAHVRHGWPLPASTQPVFSMAMHRVVACFTQIETREKRDELNQRVKLMGGKVCGDFTRHVTHLIAGQVGSTKYKVARELRVPVMLPSWVEATWEEGLAGEVHATEEKMLTAHRCGPFTGSTITVTGLDERTRTKVADLCRQNGGTYSGELTRDICTHLLVGSKTSTKYKFARQWKMFCVTAQWLYDSAESGYCQPEELYDADSSSDGQEGGKGGGRGRGRGEELPEWAKNLAEFKVPSITEGYFLDGCKIYFSGFSDEQLEKLHRIVNLGGGARYDHLSENVSHVVMGRQEPSELEAINCCSSFVVSPQWLLESCSVGEKVGEDQFAILHTQPLPLQTRGKKRKLEEATAPTHKRQHVDPEAIREEERELMMQYQSAELPEAPPTTRDEGCGFLSERQVCVSTLFSPEERRIAVEVVERHGGRVVSPPRGLYHIVPLETARGREEERDAAQQVTMIWLQRCIEAGSLLDPSSYFLFQPMATAISDTTLTNCVLAFSQFSDLEREHLVRFSKGLGAVVQDHFARYPGHNLLATTHLILKHPSGEKLTFALKWGIPAVADSWLFACAKSQKIVPVGDHLMKADPEQEDDEEREGEDVKEGRGDEENVKRGAMSESGGGSDEEDVETPEKTFRPHFDLEAAYKLIPSGPGENTQLAAIFTENLAKGLEKIRKEDERRKTVLSGVVLCVSKKLSSREAHFHNLAGSLGADCHWSFDETCTHFVYQGRASEASRDREVRVARENGCVIVSPHWISACVEAGTWEDESKFPCTYNPNMALSGISTHRLLTPHSQVPAEGEEEGDTRTGERDEEQGETRTGERDDEQGEMRTGERDEEQAQEPPMDMDEVARKLQPQPPMDMDEVARKLQPQPPMDMDEVARKLQPQPPMDMDEVARKLQPQPPMDMDEVARKLQPQPPMDMDEVARKLQPQPSRDVDEVARKLQQQLEEIREAPREQRRRRSKRLLKKEEEVLPPPPHPHRSSPRSLWQRRGRRGRKREEQLTESQISDSQLLQVTYDDPEGRREKAKLLARIEMEEEMKAKGLDPKQLLETVEEEGDCVEIRTALPSVTRNPELGGGGLAPEGAETTVPQVDEQLEPHNERDFPPCTPAAPPLGVPIVTHHKGSSEVKHLYDEKAIQTRSKAPIPPRILFSSLDQREKVDYGALVQELGGEYIDRDYFTLRCTHLVVGKASRTEKFLGACAAGKWVLHKSFLEACRAANGFVEEEEHEWGVNVSEGNSLEAAPRKWRLKLAEKRRESGETSGSMGAFQGWKVLLFAERNKLPGLRRLLEAGGAQVLPTTGRDLPKEVSHAFINMNYFPKDTFSLADLVRAGVHCLKPEYIAEYLSKGSEVPLEGSYINEVRPLLQR